MARKIIGKQEQEITWEDLFTDLNKVVAERRNKKILTKEQYEFIKKSRESPLASWRLITIIIRKKCPELPMSHGAIKEIFERSRDVYEK